MTKIDPTVALKYDQVAEKLPWDLLPIDAAEGVVKVLLYGQRKYTICGDCGARIYPNPRLDGDPARSDCPSCASKNIISGSHNWRKGFDWTRLIASIWRHFMHVARGHDIDDESGLPNVDHLNCCVMFLSEHMKHNLGKDNRFKYPKE